MILGFDTSERRATAGLFNGPETLHEIDSEQWLSGLSEPDKAGSSTAILSMLQRVLEVSNVSHDQLSAIALSNGPGTFTGLRVGVVAARMLCYAWDLPVVVVNSLEVSADRLRRSRTLGENCRIWAAVNAQRKQVFATGFNVQEDGSLNAISDTALYDRDSFLQQLKEGDHVSGNGASMYADEIRIRTGIELPEKNMRCCDATGVARLASIRFANDDFDDLWKIEPIYFRPSAAEEMRLGKQA